jgi:peptide/nickel transport system substrate-binding protein
LGGPRADERDDQGHRDELVAVDDRTFRWALKKPLPKMLLALGKIGTPCCFIMPARIAATDPFRQIGEYVGSGPMRFDEAAPGCRAPPGSASDFICCAQAGG